MLYHLTGGDSLATELKVFTAEELQAADPQPPQFVIDQILPAGFVILAAPPKTGKSWLCLALADAIAEGSTFWGFQTVKGSALYLALEDSGYRLNSRLKAIGSRMPPNLHLAIRGAETIGGGLIEQIGKWADSVPDGKLIVIDTLGRVKSAGRPGMNAYEADTQMFAPLQQFAVKRGICLIGVSHFSKAKGLALDDPYERITGSMGAFGVADAAWILCGKRGEDQTLRITGRDITDAEYKLHFKGATWHMLGNSEALEKQAAIDAYKQAAIIRTIRALVKEQGFWEGSATILLNEIWSREHDCSAANARELGRQIHQYRDMLLEIDGIAYSQRNGGKAGRSYRFATAAATLI